MSPSAHLWQITATEIAITFEVSVSIPIAIPSKVAWIPKATYNKYGAHNFSLIKNQN